MENKATGLDAMCHLINGYYLHSKQDDSEAILRAEGNQIMVTFKGSKCWETMGSFNLEDNIEYSVAKEMPEWMKDKPKEYNPKNAKELIDALLDGKLIKLNDEALYRLHDNSLELQLILNDEEWSRSILSIDYFLINWINFKILAEKPMWFPDTKFPYKIGDILITGYDTKESFEFTSFNESDEFPVVGIESDGTENGWRYEGDEDFRIASKDEQIEYWKLRLISKENAIR